MIGEFGLMVIIGTVLHTPSGVREGSRYITCIVAPQMIHFCCLFQMKDITRDPTFGDKLEQGETFTIQKNGVTVSVVFNDGSQTGYVDAGYMEWAYDIVVETTAEALRLNSCRAGSLGLEVRPPVMGGRCAAMGTPL